jgi:flagellar motor protein MotB
VVRRDKGGNINLLNLVVKEQKKKPAGKEKQPPRQEKKSALKIRVDDITLESASVAFIDALPEEPVNVRVTPLNLKMVNLSTEKGARGNLDLALTLDKGGSISVKGPLGIDPLLTELAIDVKKINIRTFQPYFTDKIKINVTRGAVSADGRFALVQESAGKPRMKYNGKISVSNLATVDKAFSNDFINWKQLYFDRVDAGFDPLDVNIKGLSLTDFYARIMINSDGTLNVQNIFGEKGREGEDTAGQKVVPAAPVGQPVQAATPKERAPNINIRKVTLQGGTIDFTDRFIKSNYSAQMLNIGGSITGLSSNEISKAAVDLRGNLGHGAPVEITGKVNPLIKDLYADLKLSFKNIELSPVTPYSSKYVGHPILKGKLTFDITYLIEKRKLDAQNKIFIDQLTFGDKVESPDAIKAPVTLAVSLLKDRNGQINLDIPVSGSLDDPQFKVWPIIWKIIVNLITKAVTAPFSLLASLVGGGGEEMSYIEFDYGSDLVTPAGQQKIKSLAKALSERPNINIDIEGYVDVEKDKEGLRQAAFSRKIKSQKLKDQIRKGDPAVPVDQVQIQPQEYEQYITLAYKAEKFPKPRNILGLAKSLPPKEMEKLMLANIAVTDSDMRLLASRRAERVKELILKGDEVAPGRIFIVGPQSLSPQKKEKAKDSRVDFKLK